MVAAIMIIVIVTPNTTITIIETGFHHVTFLGLETSNLQSSSCLCLLSVESKSTHHHRSYS